VVAGEEKPTEITVSATDDRRFDVLAVQADPLLAVTVRPGGDVAPGKAKPGRRAGATGSSRYVVTIAPKPDVPIGQAVREVTLATNLPRAEKIPIRVVLAVAAPVQVVPERLVVQPAVEAPVVHARISKRDGGGLEILGVASSDPDFVATVTPIDGGRAYDVAVRYTGRPGRGPVDVRITAKTNQRRQTAVVIPLQGRI
jgi:hypothetical protein